ncbi:OB-fold protein [Spongiimicrobium sp. 3-5]|uniref:OB-fold protein n=1 Tax=Spongiimicrobium sp. 3-5 TaxID=3332596 RepID=UPI00398050C4
MIVENKGKVFFLFAGVLFFSAITYYAFYHVDRMDTAKAPTEVKISSENLVTSFLADENSANSKFVEKTIEVAGVVREITFLNDRYTIFLQGGGEFCLMCDMQANQLEKVRSIRPGQEVLLKGICKGFLIDAILLNCVLLNKN